MSIRNELLEQILAAIQQANTGEFPLTSRGFNNGYVGGTVPQMTVATSATVDISGGSSFLGIDRSDPSNPSGAFVEFAGATGYTPTYLGGSVITSFVYVNTDNGLLVESDLTPVEVAQNLSYIGNIDYTTTTTPNDTVLAVNSFVTTAYSSPATAQTVNLNHGSFNLSGCVYSSSTGLTLTHSAGLGVRVGVNTVNNVESPDIIAAAADSISRVFRVYTDAAGATQVDAIDSVTKAVDPSKYVDNGVLTSLAASKFTVLYIYHFYGSDTTFVYYSAVNANSLELAESLVTSYGAPGEGVTKEAELRSALVIKSNVTDINAALGTNAKFITLNR